MTRIMSVKCTSPPLNAFAAHKHILGIVPFHMLLKLVYFNFNQFIYLPIFFYFLYIYKTNFDFVLIP